MISTFCIACDIVSCRRICNSLLLSCQVDYYLYLCCVVYFQSLPHFSTDSTQLFSWLTFSLQPFRLFSFCFHEAYGAGSSPIFASCSTSRLGLSRPFGTRDSYAGLKAASHADYLLSGSNWDSQRIGPSSQLWLCCFLLTADSGQCLNQRWRQNHFGFRNCRLHSCVPQSSYRPVDIHDNLIIEQSITVYPSWLLYVFLGR